MLINRTLIHLLRAPVLVVCTVLAACGGGSGGSGFVPPAPPPPPGGSGWQPGVFLDASTFQNFCQNPRSGIDPATNLPFVDLQGTTLDENNFLRSYSDDTYLWYSEIVDQDPGLFNDPLIYFDELRTLALTPSGQLKDKFHFTLSSDEWFQLSQSGVSAGYGITWTLISSSPPREVVVAYTEPNSPATNAVPEILRGARVLSINGVDVANGTDVDTLNAGLFPSDPGLTYTFEIEDLDLPGSRTVQLTSANITSDPVQNVSFVTTPAGDRIGYMLFNDHILTAEDELVAAVNQLNANGGIDDLVLDIRYNGGGFLFIASQLAYMIGGPTATAGMPFETLQFNDKHPVTNPVTGEALQPTPFFNITTDNQSLPVLNLPTRRVYVLTGPGTCSASESIMNSLRGVDVDVIQIGSTTCGKPYGFFPTDNCGTTYFTIQFRGVNAKDFGDYSDGFSPENTAGTTGVLVPGCSVADDFASSLGSPAEARFSAALAYRDTGLCPAATGVAGPGLNKLATPQVSRDGVVVKNPFLTNRILSRP